MAVITRSLKNIGRKKFRSFLVIIFLAFIIGIFVIMIQISQASSQKYQELESQIQNTIEVRPLGSLGVGGQRETPFEFKETIEKIKNIPNVISVERILIKRTFFEDESFEIINGIDTNSALRVVGEPEPIDSKLVAGKVFNSNESNKKVAIIGKNIAQKNGINLNNSDALMINIQDKKFNVIGIFETGNDFTDNQLFIPFNVFKKLFNSQGISKFFVTVDNIQNTNNVVGQLKILLPQADIIANEESINLAKSSLQVIGSTSFYSSVFFFVVGALLAIFIMMLVFRERIKEVGTLKAIGASNLDIAKQFVTESIILTLLGGMGGLIISSLGLYFFSLSWTNIQFDIVTSPFTFSVVVKMLIASIILGAIGSLYPIIRAMKLSPVKTLRME